MNRELITPLFSTSSQPAGLHQQYTYTVYILRPQSTYLGTPFDPKYLLDRYMDPLGTSSHRS